ncbi:FecR family protein [Phenylobacterium sp.]|uniref:FecR family protein n=1 Tax=Phenylobacterium sp. TaxID=1871053 RepID=UPI002E335DBF|nr:FecR domain-containing protein [Phenylobacterium sp.]HEX3364165.1 FecR domain-containing protein [Phenylobacterium sp.]
MARDEHRRALESAERAWGAFEEAEGDEILAAMRRHALAGRPRVWSDWRRISAMAASLLVAAGAGLYFAQGPGHRAPVSAPAIQYVSARGEVKQIRLPDGGGMTLDADSVAIVQFAADRRTVQLTRGRAFFVVVHDPSRPFAVAALDRRVVAVGTRFDVNLTAGALTVTLEEGRLKVASADRAAGTVMLEAGQQLVERSGRDTVRTIGARTANAVAWRTGLVSFDDQPLAEAAAVMNRYSKDQIVIGDPAVASMRVSGQFRAGEADRFAQTLAELYGLKPVRRANQIELVRGG